MFTQDNGIITDFLEKRLCTPSRVKEILQRNGKKYTLLDVEFKRCSPIDKPNVLYHTQYCVFRDD